MAKTKLIPFDWALYQEGAKAVYKNDPSKEILKVIKINKNIEQPLVVINFSKEDNETEDLDATFHSLNGSFWRAVDLEYYKNDTDTDLMLEIPIEEKVFWINVYPADRGDATIWTSEAQADQYAHSSRLGKLKFTYTEEDLIK